MQIQNTCVPCWLQEGEEYKVTKEHLWGGECVATIKRFQEASEAMLGYLDQVHMGVYRAPFGRLWKGRCEQVETQEHSLQNHGQGAFLVGIWDNEFIREAKNRGVEVGLPDVITEQLIKKMMFLWMQEMYKVRYVLQLVVETWVKEPLDEKEGQEWLEKKRQPDFKMSSQRCQKIWNKEWEGSGKRYTWEGDEWVLLSVREMMAREQDVAEKELEKGELQYVGKVKQAWVRRLNQMLYCKTHPREMAAQVVYFRGKVKQKWLQGCVSWSEIQQHVLSLEGIKGAKYK